MVEKALVELGVRDVPGNWKDNPLRTMWLRGLVSKKGWPLEEPQEVYEWIEGSRDKPAFKGKVCTDGSGGLHSSDTDQRRCGWAAVQVDPSKRSE